MDAIVLGLGVNGLAVVRSLGCKFLTLAGIYFDKHDELGIHSKYLHKTAQINKLYQPDELLALCLSLSGNNQKHKPVLFCSTDGFAATVSEHQALFEQHFIITTPNHQMYWNFVAKQPTADICQVNNFPIPTTVYCQEVGQLAELSKPLHYPLIIKPNLTFGDKFPGKNLVVEDQKQLEQFITDYPELETDVVVQEIVPSGDGKIFLVTCYCDKSGKVRIIYSGKKIRQYLPDYGVTCFGVSEDIPYLKDITTRFLEKINYTGYATLEFAYDNQANEYYFIELNIRSFYHNQLFKDAGLDVNYHAYQLETQPERIKNPCLNKQKNNVYWLDFTRDFGSFMRKPNLSLWQWLRSLLKSRSFAYFQPNDLKPFIISVKVFLSITIKSLSKSKESKE